jgi:hypothetical protein
VPLFLSLCKPSVIEPLLFDASLGCPQHISTASELLLQMIDVASASLIASIVALLASLTSASITAWVTFYSDRRKHLQELEKAMSKYRNPLILAATALERKLWAIAPKSELLRVRPEDHAYFIEWTCFLVGRYFCWTYILRHETQFLQFSHDEQTKYHMQMLDMIAIAFNRPPESSGDVFRIWSGEQEALGEEMTSKDGEQLMCIGFSTFRKLRRNGEKFHNYSVFRRLERDIDAALGNGTGGPQVWRLRHLLANLLDQLDPRWLYHDKPEHYHCKCPMCTKWTRECE